MVQTCLAECVLVVYASQAPSARCFQWQATRTKEIDLIVCTGDETIGFCFKEFLVPRYRDFAALRLGIKSKVIDRGFFVCFGAHAFVTARAAIGLSVSEFLGQLDRWLACRSFGEARQILWDLPASSVPRTRACSLLPEDGLEYHQENDCDSRNAEDAAKDRAPAGGGFVRG